MRHSLSHTQLRSQLFRPISVASRGARRVRVNLSVAGAAGLLASSLLVTASAAAAASSDYAVTQLSIGADAYAVGSDPVTNTIYVGWYSGIAVIDGTTNTVTAQIAGVTAVDGGSVSAIAVDSATDTVYALGSGFLFVINGTTNTVTTSFNLPCAFPSMAVNSVTDMIYVTGCPAPGETDGDQGAVDVIDGATNTLTATIPVSVSQQFTSGVAVDTGTNTVYVADPGDGQLAVIDGATNTVTDRIAIPSVSNTGVAFDPASGLVYTADQKSNEVSVIDPATGSVSAVATGLTGAQGVALDPSTGTLYVVSMDGPAVDPSLGMTYVIDTASGAVADQFPRGGQFVTVPVSGGPAYIGGLLATSAITVATPSSENTMSPAIVGTTSFTFTVGQAGQAQLTASATPAATFSLATYLAGPTYSLTLPAGLTLSSSGLIAGSPAAGTGGSYTITVVASNGVAPSTSANVSLTIDEAPTITSADEVTFGTGVAGSFTVTANGFPAPTFAESGTLPAGVTFSSGVLSGTPAAGTAGSYPIQITATNTAGTAAQAFTLVVNPAPTSAPAALSDSDGSVALYTVGSDGNVWAYFPGAFTVVQQLTTTGDFVGTPAVVATSNGDIGIYARTTSGMIMGATEDGPGGTVSAWTQLGIAANLVSDPVALLTASGAIAIYGSDSGGAVEGISQSAAYSAFGSWQTLSPDEGFAGRPGVIQTSSGVIAIYATTSADSVLGTSQSAPFGPFGSWGQIGSATDLVSDPSVLLTASGAIAIYAADSGGAIDGISQSAPYSAFGSWQTLSPQDGFTGPPAVLQTSSGVIALYATTTSGTVLGTSQSVAFGPFSSWAQIGTATDLISNPMALITTSGAIAIYAADSSGEVSAISQSVSYGPFGSWTEL
jgi:YVTN family beta-propeller protein